MRGSGIRPRPVSYTHLDVYKRQKQTFATLNDVPEASALVMGRLATAAARYAKAQGFADDGYRIVMNCNGDGGQTVFQIHLHLLAGAPLGRFGTP